MKLLRKYIRIIAVSLLLVVVQAFVLPIAALALTSGPASPEFATFEPVDATDMVNLQTGDFTYTLPVMNVPGPEGGYPLSLSYHAGITMEQDASWVGLGWTLNAGAINREVHGFPDDWNGNMIDVAAYNAGGETTYSYLSLGGSIDGAGGGLSLNWENNFKSIGVSLYGSIGFHNGIGITGSIGTNGFSVGLGLGFNTGDLSIGGSIGLHVTWKGSLSELAGLSVGLAGGSPLKASLGISLSAKGTDFSVSLPGFNSTSNNISLGKVSVSENTSFFGIILPIPSPWGLATLDAGYGQTVVKWWVDQELNQHVYGPLYITGGVNVNQYGEQSYLYKMDIYNEFYDASGVTDPARNESNKNSLSFPNFDLYIVNGQGIGGSITPYYPENGFLVREARDLAYNGASTIEKAIPLYNTNDITNNIPLPSANSKTYFRFVDSPESYYKSQVDQNSYSNAVFDHFPFTTSKVNTNLYGESTFNPTINRLGGSRHIEWFKNSEITSGGAKNMGFLEYEGNLPDRSYAFKSLNDIRGDRLEADPDGIGGFKITVEDGKTYHYSLPVFQFEELKVKQKHSDPNSQYLNYYNFNIYAYTWLLTAITGPDYYDKDGDGKVSDADWGYFVKFKYGKWTNNYIWASPYSGYTIDGDYQNKTFGRKQVYYLNSIETRSHIAYFIKSVRQDGFGSPLTGQNGSLTGVNKHQSDYFKSRVNNGYSWYSYVSQIFSNWSSNIRHQPLALDRILLVKKDPGNLYKLNEASNGPNELIPVSDVSTYSLIKEYSFVFTYPDNNYNYPDLGHVNVPTKNDAIKIIKDEINPFGVYEWDNTPGKDLVRDNTLSSISYSYPYFSNSVLDEKDLPTNYLQKALKTVNFNYDYSLFPNTINSALNNGVYGGKLALTSVSLGGKGDERVVPPYIFTYYTGQNNGYSTTQIDNWGYRSEYDSTFNTNVGNSDLFPKQLANVGSLKSITSPLGSIVNITYDNDAYYKEAALDNNSQFHLITSCSFGETSNIINIQNTTNLSQDQLLQMIHVGDHVVTAIPYTQVAVPHVVPAQSGTDITHGDVNTIDIVNGNIQITLINTGDTFDMPPNSYTPPIFTAGKLTIPIKQFYGGGLKVSSISLNEPSSGSTQTTTYNYNNPNTGIISGITSYAPYKDVNKFIPYISEIPSPQVMYEYVTVKTLATDGTSIGSSIYHFQVLTPVSAPFAEPSSSTPYSMGNLFQVNDQFIKQYDSPSTNQYGRYRHAQVIRNLNKIGQILDVSVLDNNNRIVQKTVYNYVDPANAQVGVYQESFADAIHYINSGVSYVYYTSVERLDQPCLLQSVTSTANGITVTQTNQKFDIYTGQVTQSNYNDSYGNNFTSVTVPAYTKYPGMQSKVWNQTNANMLTQSAESYTYLTSDPSKILGASVQTWNPNWQYSLWNSASATWADQPNTNNPAWRKQTSYAWNSQLDAQGYYQGFIDYNWASVAQDPGWQAVSQVTRYDQYSNPLEAIDINNRAGSTRMTSASSNTMSSSSNAYYGQQTATGFEQLDAVTGNKNFDGQVSVGNSTQGTLTQVPSTTIPPHTGDYSVQLNNPAVDLVTLNQYAGSYLASVWVHLSSPNDAGIKLSNSTSATNGSVTVTKANAVLRAGDWYLLNAALPCTAGTNFSVKATLVKTSTGAAYFDDFRIQPVNSSMTHYIYDAQTNAVNYILDNDNMGTQYLYDNQGRLKEVRAEQKYISDADKGGFLKVKQADYQYARPNQ